MPVSFIIDDMCRFRMLAIGIYVGMAISSTYGYSIFTEHLRNKYEFNQADITAISTVGNCCGFLCFFAGMLFDYAGPKVVLSIAGSLGFLGYLLFGLAFNDVIPKHESKEVNMIIFCIFNAFVYFGCPALDVATLIPLMLNFPLDRGYMVIIQKTFAGLGTSIIMAYFNGWFRDLDVKENSLFAGYAYFLAAQVLVCAGLALYFIELPPYYMSQYRQARVTEEEKAERAATLQVYMSQPAPRRRLYIGCVLIGVLLVYVTIASIVPGYVPTTKAAYAVMAAVCVVLLMLFSVMALPVQLLGAYTPVAVPHEHFKTLGYARGASGAAAAAPASLDVSALPDHEACVDEDHSPMELTRQEQQEQEQEQEPPRAAVRPDPQYQGSFWSHLLTLDLWLLWITFFGLWGTGAVMQMNAAQIYRSINKGGFDQSMLTLYVALMGVGSAFGRIISGVVDMKFTQWRQEGRTQLITTMFLPVGSVLIFLAYLFFAIIPADGLVLPFLLASIGNGMGWGLGALSVRIAYAEDIGKHLNFLYSSGFICTIALNRFMFGEMYDNEARRLGTAPNCDAVSCVRNQMLILMAVNVLSFVTGLAAHLRYARFVRVEKGVLDVNTSAIGGDAATTSDAEKTEPLE